jgi:transcriptional regulator with XRE-family HTH domain
MATKLEITPSAYCKIERHITDPSVGRLEQIAIIFNIHIKDFFTEPSTTPSNRQLSLEQLNARTNKLSRQLTSLQKTVAQLQTTKRSRSTKKIPE